MGLTGTPLLLPLHAEPGDLIAPLTPASALTGWTWDWSVAIGLAVMLGLYLWGVQRLRRRGDAWGTGRTIMWCLGGGGSIAIATLSAVGTYDTVLFSAHMVQHMILTMVTPVFMAAGAPITLLLRNLGTAGRRRLVAFLHSWFGKLVMFPPLATFLMIANPYAMYFSDWYLAQLENDVAHNLTHVWLITLGCMYFWPLLGSDPVPIRPPYPLRMMLLLVTMPSHAFLGTTIMGSSHLIAEEWYVGFGRTWSPSPLEDQYIAGAIMWATGDLTMVVIMGVFFYQWYTSSVREAKRIDRQLDREERLAARHGGNHGYDEGDRDGSPDSEEKS